MDSALHRLIDQVLTAVDARTPLRIRGGGSKDFYGQLPQGDLLDVTPVTGIVSYEPSELVVTVRAGTPLVELQAALAASGQYLACEPPAFGVTPANPSRTTCGGLVAAGLSGPARANAGAVRDFVLGATVLNGRGELLTFGGQVIKNVAGYDVSRLMVGALGTLGLLTEISLKVLPVPPGEATLMGTGLSQQKALDLLQRWRAQPLPLSASCWVMDDSVSPARQCLFVRLRGAIAAVAAAGPQLMAELRAAGAEAELMDNTQAGPDWQACCDQTLPFFTPTAPDLCLWRLSLSPTAPALDLPYAQLIEWHGAQRWLWAPLAAQAHLRQLAARLGGSATLFRAAASAEAGAQARFTPLTAPLAQIHQRLKHEFDPAGIFNRGRLYPEF